MMKKFKTLDEIFNNEVKVRVNAEFAPFRIQCDGPIRESADPYDAYCIVWTNYYLDEETSDEIFETVAMAELRASSFGDYVQAIEYMDDCSDDARESAIVAGKYFEMFPRRCREIKWFQKFYGGVSIYDLHTFYVSPKFRGKGVATVILQQLPLLLRELHLSHGIITAYINPFKRQDVELPDSEDKMFDSFNDDRLIKYSNHKSTQSKEITEQLKKLLEKCGFSNTHDMYYAVSLEYLAGQAKKKSAMSEYVYSLWE